MLSNKYLETYNNDKAIKKTSEEIDRANSRLNDLKDKLTATNEAIKNLKVQKVNESEKNDIGKKNTLPAILDKLTKEKDKQTDLTDSIEGIETQLAGLIQSANEAKQEAHEKASLQFTKESKAAMIDLAKKTLATIKSAQKVEQFSMLKNEYESSRKSQNSGDTHLLKTDVKPTSVSISFHPFVTSINQIAGFPPTLLSQINEATGYTQMIKHQQRHNLNRLSIDFAATT